MANKPQGISTTPIHGLSRPEAERLTSTDQELPSSPRERPSNMKTATEWCRIEGGKEPQGALASMAMAGTLQEHFASRQ